MAQRRIDLSTTMAPVGQVFWHKLHRMQLSTSLWIWPFKPAGACLVSTGVKRRLRLF